MGWSFEGGIPVDGHWSYYVARVDGDEVGGFAPWPGLSTLFATRFGPYRD
jgi:hypothetical protein